MKYFLLGVLACILSWLGMQNSIFLCAAAGGIIGYLSSRAEYADELEKILESQHD